MRSFIVVSGQQPSLFFPVEVPTAWKRVLFATIVTVAIFAACKGHIAYSGQILSNNALCIFMLYIVKAGTLNLRFTAVISSFYRCIYMWNFAYKEEWLLFRRSVILLSLSRLQYTR